MSHGWRFWIARPAEDVLRSPYYGLGKVPPWPARHLRATCRKHHAPPALGCPCGVYADHVLDVARARAQCFPAIVSKWGPFGERGFRAAEWVRFVGVCSLEDAEVVPIVVPRMDFAGIGIARRLTPDELRAASADLLELYVFDEDSGRRGVDELVDGLARRYGVLVNPRCPR
jgi:hypothetical protein